MTMLRFEPQSFRTNSKYPNPLDQRKVEDYLLSTLNSLFFIIGHVLGGHVTFTDGDRR
jgi:hypothetical protein